MALTSLLTVAGLVGERVNQTIVIRADSSLQAGIGHVMRCLTLADALTGKGAECHFICREQPGNLIDHLRSKGYPVHVLPASFVAEGLGRVEENALSHSHWLGVSQQRDADQSAAILRELRPDWLIVDHYALDFRWEQEVKPLCHKLMVIDDLADRTHACNLLLDQTFGRDSADYRSRVPADCQLLCGTRYALLRPEFAALRQYSLQRRVSPQLAHLLISMGGVDKDNVTAQVMIALCNSSLPERCRITVVMGSTAPWMEKVQRLAADMPWTTEVRVGVSDMAQLMADSDLAIGAAGATSWERCCLGLPTIMMVLAENQRLVAQGLEKEQAAFVIKHTADISACLPELLQGLIEQPMVLQLMTQSAARIVDGQGTVAVMQQLEH